MKAKIYYYHADHLQSAQFITDANGEKYEHIEYTPYGELWIEETAPGVDKLPFRFTGKELDEETGLYYYGARYLDPKYSRWLSGDPAITDYMAGTSAGEGGIYNTVNLSVYHYAGNNPVKYTDPDGRANTLSITPSDVELFLEETKQALSSIPTPAIVCVGIASGLIIANELSDGAVFEGIADGINFVIDKATETGKSIANKGKEFGTWLNGKAKSVWDNIFLSRNHPKGAPDSLGGIDRDASGSRNDRHAHSKKPGDWAINEDGTAHDGNTNRIPKDVAEFLKKRGFKIPDDRIPLKNNQPLETN